MGQPLYPVTPSHRVRMSDLPSETDEQGPGAPEGPAEQSADQSAEPTPEPPTSALDTDRYAHLSLGSGQVVIYDRDDPETWVQSDTFVEVGP